jgi:UDP-4-amino-4,6-dideoxy-L-N-acetyl-beta-L-altrosamine transaminase
LVPYSRQLIEQDDIDAVVDVLKSDFLTTGPKVDEFERELANFVGTKYAVVFNSATSALLASYGALELKEGDEVITTPISFVATSNMLLHYGVKPVFVDVKSDGNIDETLIEDVITDKTKAIVSVDFAGNPVEYTKIKEIANKNNLHFISDSSHSLGAEYKGKKIGSLADMSVFSFHAVKPITTGEGGAITTDSEEYYKKLKLICSHGIQRDENNQNDMVAFGYNLRLSDISCALGLSQLKKLDSFIEHKEKLAFYYNDVFAYNELFDTLEIARYKKSSYHLFPIFLKGDLADKRDELFDILRADGVGVQIHYKPIYQNSYYKNLYGEMSLENADRLYATELSLPLHQGLSFNDVKNLVTKIIKAIEQVLKIEHDFTKPVDDLEDVMGMLNGE